MIVVFDFDYTLFDRVKFFSADLPDAIGVDRKIFHKAYEKNFRNQKTGKVDYDLEKHLDILGINNLATLRKINQFMQTGEKYLMPGAVEILNNYKNRGDEMFLITFGNPLWQKKKIGKIEVLNKFFDDKHKIYNNKGKEKSVDFLKKKGQKIAIINDNLEESLKMKEAIGSDCDLYLIKSRYSANLGYEGKLYKNLKELNKELFYKE
jgi:hypothetical protein